MGIRYLKSNIIIKKYGQYNPGLGIVVKDKNSIRDHINKLKDTTGASVVEVGNEKIKNSEIKSDYSEPSKRAYEYLSELNRK